MRFRSGYEIVCPDGELRHLPYHNLGDAECDARVVSRPGRCEHWDAFAATPCPGGEHTVRPCVFTPPQPRGEA